MKTVSYETLRAIKAYPYDMEPNLHPKPNGTNLWTAMDVLNIPDDACSCARKIIIVLRSDFLDDATLFEFACRCAERALSILPAHDKRCDDAISTMRLWMRGGANWDDVHAAWVSAKNAARDAGWEYAYYATLSATRTLSAGDAARSAAWDAAWAAVRAASCDAACDAARDVEGAAWAAAGDAAWDAASAAAWEKERAWQVAELRRMLEDAQ